MPSNLAPAILDGAGALLPAPIARSLSTALAEDVTSVRIHTDRRTADAAALLNARAFAVGEHIGFGSGMYRPETAAGRELIAHELAHVVQYRRDPSRARVRRDLTRQSLSPQQVQAMTDERLVASIRVLESFLREHAGDDPTHAAADGNLRLLQADLARRSISPPDADTSTPPVVPLRQTGVTPLASLSSEAAALPEGGLRGLSYGIGIAHSPPRSFLHSLVPAVFRWPEPRSSLGFDPQSGMWTVERYVDLVGHDAPPPDLPLRRQIAYRLRLALHGGPQALDELVPRFMTEGRALEQFESLWRREPRLLPDTPGADWVMRDWIDPVSGRSVRITAADLRRAPDLWREAVRRGLGDMDAADQALLRAMMEAHATRGQVAASPFLSATAQPELSTYLAQSVPERSFLRGRRYIVQLEVPAEAAADLNTILPGQGRQHLAGEIEVLVTTDVRGNIVNIRPNPTTGLGRFATGIRVLGHGANVASFGYSGYRIATASEAERQRVIGEEVGSQVLGWAGAAGAVGVCILLGAPTGGLVTIACGVIGGIGGGYAGSELGGAAAEAIDPAMSWLAEESLRRHTPAGRERVRRATQGNALDSANAWLQSLFQIDLFTHM